MYERLTIFQKGLLLFSLPLLLQAIFVGILVKTQAEVVDAQGWAVHTKEVIAKVEETYRGLLEGLSSVRIPVTSGNRSISQRDEEIPDQYSRQLQELRDLVSDNPQQVARLQALDERARAFLDWFKSRRTEPISGAGVAGQFQLGHGAQLLGAVRAIIDEILDVEEILDRERMDALHRTTARQLRAVAGGGLLILVTGLILALVFFQSVVKRLATLRENVILLGAGEALRQPMWGRDEIAEVDRAFHVMASNLAQQRQENEMFVYSVSHDLRSPLINLQGFSEELSLSCKDIHALFELESVPASVRDRGIALLGENIEESIRFIQTAVGRLARIIDALLRLSRAGRVEYQFQITPVRPIVEKVVEALDGTITSRRAKVSIGNLPPAWSDPTAVEQIFANLIANSVQYLEPERSGRIEIGWNEDAGPKGPAGLHVYFVKDNGLGIPEAYQQRVFTPFNRLHANVAQGEGIGLSLVRRVVERLGGKIWLESSAGVGSTFFVALPSSARTDSQSPGVDGARTPPLFRGA